MNPYQKLLKYVRRATGDRQRLLKMVGELQGSVDEMSARLARLEAGGGGEVARPGVGVAIVGVRGHGAKHIAAFQKLSNCHIAAICDVDEKVGRAAVAKIEAAQGFAPSFTTDVRALLTDDSVDALAIATPHHWHAVSAWWGLRAGKHVYLEKPVTHTIAEGPVLIAAAEKYGRVIQSGNQLRSNTSLAAAGEFMRSGGLGDVTLVHCIIHKARLPMPPKAKPVPASVDYDLWCGPAPLEDPKRSKFHYHWHWFWEYGNGALGNNGVHRIDAARIALGLEGFGDLALSIGGRFGPEDGGETPNTQLALHRFGDVWVLQDILGLDPDPYLGIENGVVFHGTEGRVVYQAGKAVLVDDDGEPVRTFEGKQQNHYADFLAAIEAGDPSRVRGDLAEAVRSSDLCHLGNISHQLGATTDDATIRATLAAVDAPTFVHERFDAMRANLDGIGDDRSFVLGRSLTDLGDGELPATDDPGVEGLLHRSYRSPFELPSAADV